MGEEGLLASSSALGGSGGETGGAVGRTGSFPGGSPPLPRALAQSWGLTLLAQAWLQAKAMSGHVIH